MLSLKFHSLRCPVRLSFFASIDAMKLLEVWADLEKADVHHGNTPDIICTCPLGAARHSFCIQQLFSFACSVRLDDKGGEVVLVPLADLFNHDPSSEAYLVWDPQQQGVVLKPDKAYKPGEQVQLPTLLATATGVCSK